VKKILEPYNWFDFSLSYDVPPGNWEDVKLVLKDLTLKIGIKSKVDSIIKTVEWATIKEWYKAFTNDAGIASQKISSALKINANIPTVSIQDLFRSPYEAVTYIFLKQFERKGFYVAKYQGHLVDYFIDEPSWQKFAANNPDLVVTDGFISLIECKSEKEWGSELTLSNKKIPAELMQYSKFVQLLAEKAGSIKNPLAVFSYQGNISNKNRADIEKFLKSNCPYVIIILGDTLQQALIDHSVREKLRELVTHTQGYESLTKYVIV
jgi:hypothetical protein